MPYSRRHPRTGAVVGLCTCLLSATCPADDPPERFGAVGPFAACCDAGITVTWQATDLGTLKPDLLASFDFLYRRPLGPGEVFAYLEGATTPRGNGVAAGIPDGNGDAGSAADAAGRGRLQLSELFYRWFALGGNVSAGLVNPASALDLSDVANDETAQFLAVPLVNNPTIGFPDYTLGALHHLEARPGRPGLTTLLTASHGLGDNDPASYGELLDVTADGRGVFAALELYSHQAAWHWRTGAWVNSAEHDRLDGSGRTGANYGAYLVADGPVGGGRWGGRLGAANPAVSEAAWFASLALIQPLGGAEGGLGLAYTASSGELAPDPGDRWLAEGYVKFALSDRIELTPALQYLHNAAGGAADGENGWVAGLRLNLAL